jgi:transcriptional regulator PpsR
MRSDSPADVRVPFADPDAMFAGFDRNELVDLGYEAGDFLLAIDHDNCVRDAAQNDTDCQFVRQWIGAKWIDTVTVESKPKIEQMLDPQHDKDKLWRQVNHPVDDETIPVKYRLFRPAEGNWAIAIGRDLRPISALQQRLLKTQQSMERDYLTLRQTETRYRLLFDNIAYPVMIVDAEKLTVQQANLSLHLLASSAPGSLDGKSLLDLFQTSSRDPLVAHIGAAAVSEAAGNVEVQLAGQEQTHRLSLSSFRQSGKRYWLINIDEGEREHPTHPSDRYILDAVEKMPDAFVLANNKQEIIAANRAFADLVQAGSVEQLAGIFLNRFIGRPDIDLNLLRKQLKDHQEVRNFSSIVNDLNGGEEPVEISAIMIEREQPVFGYSLRTIGRRERDLPKSDQELRSVDQLTELVGRKPLKEIVRESTDLIERMCIEAALVHTSDNRASAAEILGLSRQSLYSKLHRHGLGNLSDKD